MVNRPPGQCNMDGIGTLHMRQGGNLAWLPCSVRFRTRTHGVTAVGRGQRILILRTIQRVMTQVSDIWHCSASGLERRRHRQKRGAVGQGPELAPTRSAARSLLSLPRLALLHMPGSCLIHTSTCKYPGVRALAFPASLVCMAHAVLQTYGAIGPGHGVSQLLHCATRAQDLLSPFSRMRPRSVCCMQTHGSNSHRWIGYWAVCTDLRRLGR